MHETGTAIRGPAGRRSAASCEEIGIVTSTVCVCVRVRRVCSCAVHAHYSSWMPVVLSFRVFHVESCGGLIKTSH